MASRLQAGRVPQVAEDDAAMLGASQAAGDRLSGHNILCRSQARRGPSDGDRSGAHGDLRQTGHSPAREGGACRSEAQGGGRGRRGLRFGKRRDDLPQDARREGHNILLLLRGRKGVSRTRAPLSRQRGAGGRQLLRRTQLGRVLGRLVLLYTQGREMSYGPVELFPYQRQRHGTVRADADSRGRGLVGELYGRLHRPDEGRTPAPCGGSRNSRREGRGREVQHRAELVSRRRLGK